MQQHTGIVSLRPVRLQTSESLLSTQVSRYFYSIKSQVEVPMIHLRGKITHTHLPSAFTAKIIAFSSGSVFFINTPNSPFSTLLFNRLSNALPKQFAQLRQFRHGSYRVLSQFFFQCLWPEEQSRNMSVWLAVFNNN